MSNAGSGQVPHPVPPPVLGYPQPQTDATGGLIPYRNVPALVAYYLGVFSVIPPIGIILGIGAVALGIVGLAKASKEPHVRGKVHAWVGIIVGGLFGFGYLWMLMTFWLVPMLTGYRR